MTKTVNPVKTSFTRVMNFTGGEIEESMGGGSMLSFGEKGTCGSLTGLISLRNVKIYECW